MKKKELEQIVEFLCNYNKDDIGATCTTYYFASFRINEYVFKYIHKGKLMKSESVWGSSWRVVSNNWQFAVLEIVDKTKPSKRPKYYKLEKETGELKDIADYYNKGE